MALTKQPLPLSAPVYRNVDDSDLTDESAELIDGYLDEAGGTRRRPGLSLLLNLGTESAVDGLFWWEKKGCAIAVSGGRTYKLTYAGGVLSGADLTDHKLLVNVKVQFATDRTYCFMTNGSSIVYTDGTANTASVGDSEAPTAVDSIAFIDGYLLANNNGENRAYYSNLDNSLAWTAGDRFSAAGDSDDATRIMVVDKEIYVWGPSSLEVWENDGVNPFSRIPGGFFRFGTIAPRSTVETAKGLMWLSNRREFVEYSGRNVEVVPCPYDKEVQQFTTVSDLIAERVLFSGQDFILWQFPTENRTLAYNYRAKTWQRWGYWNSSLLQHDRFVGRSVIYCPAWGIHLVGDRRNGRIYHFSHDYESDNGEEIRMLRETGNIDRGTNNLKRCRRIMLRCKRGAANLSTEPKLMIRYRDDGEHWSNEKHISLGNLGETEMTVQLWRLGMYRQRKWEISCTDGAPVIFSRPEEEFEVMLK